MLIIDLTANCNHCETEMHHPICDLDQEPGESVSVDIAFHISQIIYKCPKCGLEHSTGDGVELVDEVEMGHREEYPEIDD